MTLPKSPRVIVPTDTALYGQLWQLARLHRIVCFAGLPGTGKSLLMQQLAHMAAAQGRTVYLLQWDVVRPVFEASAGGQRYPAVDGVTHGVIRKAVGLWARQALVAWHRDQAEGLSLCLAETPFIGNRLIELAQRHADAAEALLSAPTCCFVLPVPSVTVRQAIAAQRLQRSVTPLHPRETEDAPPHLLQALWQELYGVAPFLGVVTCAPVRRDEVPYDPEVYSRVYEAVLRHRHCCVVEIATLLPTADVSPYEFDIERRDIVPSATEVSTYIRTVEQQYPEMQALGQEIEQWYRV